MRATKAQVEATVEQAMDDEGFRLLLAEYAHAVRNQLPEEGKLERQLKIAYASVQAESERLRQLEALAKRMLSYLDRNTRNFQREKFSDFLAQLRATLAR